MHFQADRHDKAFAFAFKWPIVGLDELEVFGTGRLPQQSCTGQPWDEGVRVPRKGVDGRNPIDR